VQFLAELKTALHTIYFFMLRSAIPDKGLYMPGVISTRYNTWNPWVIPGI